MRGTISTLVIVAVLAASSSAEDRWTPSPLCPFPSEDLTRSPYEGDCTKYWECFEGARYPMDCPQGLEYNEEQHRCDTPSIAQCDKYETITYPTYPHSDYPIGPTGTDPNWSPDPLCPYPSNELIYYPYAANCSEYWECYNGERILKDCPSNLFWSVVHNWCDYLENVDCSQNNITLTPPPATSPGTTASTGSTGPWTPDPLCPYPSEAISYFVYPANCSQYWECYEGNKYLMTCPQNLVWNEAASVCDYKDNVNCDRGPTAAPTTGTTPTPAPTSTPTPAPTPTPTNGTGSTAPPTATPTPTPAPTAAPSCATLPEGTFLPNPDNCSHYFECDDGKALDLACPGNLLWNQEKSVCDYAENVTC